MYSTSSAGIISTLGEGAGLVRCGASTLVGTLGGCTLGTTLGGCAFRSGRMVGTLGGDAVGGASLIVGMSVTICCRIRSCANLIWSMCCCGRLPLIAFVKLVVAATMESDGVTIGLVMYLCLKNTVPDMRVALVALFHIFQQ